MKRYIVTSQMGRTVLKGAMTADELNDYCRLAAESPEAANWLRNFHVQTIDVPERVRLSEDVHIPGGWGTLASQSWPTPHMVPAGTEGVLVRRSGDKAEVEFERYGVIADVPQRMLEALVPSTARPHGDT